MTTTVRLLAALAIFAQQPAPPQSSTEVSIEDEVLQNVRNQPLGAGTLADLNLPEPFLRRVADRIIRASYEERYRIVVKEESPAIASGAQGGGDAARSISSAWVVGLLVFVLCAAGFVGVLLKRRERGGRT